MIRRQGRSPARRRWMVAGALAFVLSSCGLPDRGVNQVEDSTVPYQLLEPAEAAPSEAPSTARPGGRTPLVFWLDESERLVPTTADASCEQPAEVQVMRLLDALSAGLSEQDRAAGRTSALAQPAGLALVRLDDATAVVELDPQLQTGADRLPLAVAQVVVSVTSAQGVGSVAFVADGEPVQVPLPGGALTLGPVTATDYAGLVLDTGASPTHRWPGCQ